MKVKNLTELFNEFKKYRETKKDIANENNFYDYVGIVCSLKNEEDPQLGEVFATDLIETAEVTLKDCPHEVLILDFNFPALNLKAHIWGGEIEWNMEKILQDIWTIGEIKDTYGLDLSWPANRQTSEQAEENKINPKPKSSGKKDKNFVELEKQNQELRTKNKQLKKEKKVYWIGGSFAFLALVGLIVWFVLRKKNK